MIDGPSLRVAPDVRLVKNVRIPMRDGARLAADVYWPEGRDDPLPVVMDYIPYRKDEVNPASFRHYLELPRHGYAVVRVDIRGTGASEGHAVDEYVVEEQLDGYDAIEWLAAQPWCDGHVNLMGISYGGFTALQVATTRPPHLTSIIPVDVTDDRYTDDCHYRGGLLRMYYDLGWYGTRMIAWNAMPPDPASLGADWEAVWRRHVDGDEPYLLAWLRHQTDGPYWRQGSVAGSLDRIVCPTFLIGGWRDGYPNPPLRLFEGLRVPKRLLMGPWDHAYPDAAIPGPRIDHLREVVRWLDHWCRGVDTGLMDETPVAVYVMEPGTLSPDRLDEPGEWRAERAWPPDGATERVLALAADGRLTDAGGAAPAADGDAGDTLVVDPTVGVTGGLWSGGVPFGLPSDQRPDEAGSLVWTSPPLDEPLAILGRARAHLTVTSTAPVIGVAVSLIDVDPEDRSHLVAKGMLNTTRRASLSEPEPLPRGEPVDLVIDVDATGWRFPAGHRIRVAIAGADWPNVWPAPFPAELTVRHGSTIALPVVPARSALPAPVFAPSPVVVKPPSARSPRPTWTVTQDVIAGRMTATIGTTVAFQAAEGTAIERDFRVVCEVDPADPAHAVGRGHHRCRSTRDGSWTESQADVVIASDETAFHVTIELVVTTDGEVRATRSWDETIPRALL